MVKKNPLKSFDPKSLFRIYTGWKYQIGIYQTYQSLISFIWCIDIRLICQCHRLLWVCLLDPAVQS